jgi:hypothetical protein
LDNTVKSIDLHFLTGLEVYLQNRILAKINKTAYPFSFQILTIQEDVHGLRFFSEIGDSNARAANDLTGVTLAIDLAKTGPFTKLLGIRDLDQVDVVLGTESFNKLDVFGLSARFTENGQVSLASILNNKSSC